MSNFNFTPFPLLATERLTLRRLTDEDEKDIFLIRSDAGIAKYLDRPICNSMEEAKNFINKINNCIESNECIYWAISLKHDPGLIGTICFWNFSDSGPTADIGFELLSQFQGKGFMMEAVQAVIRYGFEVMQLATIDGEVDPLNDRSIALMKKYNFTLKNDWSPNKDSETKTIFYTLKNNL